MTATQMNGTLATTTTTPTESTANTSVFDKTLCLVLTRGTMGITRKARGPVQAVAAEAVESSPAFVALSKTLFRAPEFKAIKTLDSELQAFLMKMSLPSLLKGGTHAIPIPMVEQVDDEVRQYIEKRIALVAILAGAWTRIVQESETALGPQLFDPRNYPSAERLGTQFYVEHRWIDYGVPARLKAIKASIWKDEQIKAAAAIENAKVQAIQDVRGRALKLVDHIVDRLTPSPDGTKRIFRDSLLGNLREFLDLFPVLNTATGDTELSPLVERARLALDGIDPKLLRDDELVRQKVASDFAAIQTTLDGMVVESTRRIRFEDDADA